MLGSTAGADQDANNGVPADKVALQVRAELQSFATRALRHELGELRSQVRQDLSEELHKLQDLGRRESNGFAPSLRSSGNSGYTELYYPAPSATPPTLAVSRTFGPDATNGDAESMEEKVYPGENAWTRGASVRRMDAKHDLREMYRSTRAVRPMLSLQMKEETATRNSDASSVDLASLSYSRPSNRGGAGAKKRLSELEHSSKSARVFNRRLARKTLPYAVVTADSALTERACFWLGQFFESTISLFILLNGVFIGVQTHYQASNVTESLPRVFPTMEMIFCLVFTSELGVKLSYWRHKFFIMKDQWHWNLFDFLLVVFQLVEVIGMVTTTHESSESSGSSNPVGNMSFLRLLRILRLFRVLRLVRLLHFIGELATIISSIANCFRALCWTVLLLLMMIYMVAIVITQVVLTHRVGLKEENKPDSEELRKWWGTLSMSILSLYHATLGGVDWETVERPLRVEMSGGTVLSIMFSFYIAFALLAMMNIITGTFVQTALNNAETERVTDFRRIASDAFLDGRTHKTSSFVEGGEIPIELEDYERIITDGRFANWLKSMGIEPSDARLLFQLLDRSDEKAVGHETLINNMVRLREGTKFMDIMKLMYETERVAAKVDDMDIGESLEKELKAMSSSVSESVETVLAKVLIRSPRESRERFAYAKGENDNVHPMRATMCSSSLQVPNGIVSRPLSTLSSSRPSSNRPSSNRPRSSLDANRPRSTGSMAFGDLPFEIEEVEEV